MPRLITAARFLCLFFAAPPLTFFLGTPFHASSSLAYGSTFPEALSSSWGALTGALSSIVDTSGGAAAAGEASAGAPGGQGRHKRLCIPADDKRAYVTVFAGWPAEKLWGVRVLAQSLRENGGHADVVVMLPAVHAADRAVRQVLYSENLLTYVIPSSLPVSVVPTELAAKVTAWALTGYSRVIFFEPSTLVLRNSDALFACEGLA